MKKIIITLTDKQAQVIVDALDLYTRLLMGQFNEIESLFIHHGKSEFWKNDKLRELLRTNLLITKIILLPELSDGAYYSILDKDHVPFVARVAYDIQSKMNHDISWHVHREGGMTTNFDKPFHAEHSQPLPKIEFQEK